MANDVQVHDEEYDPNEDQDHSDRWGHHQHRGSAVWSVDRFTKEDSIIAHKRLYRTPRRLRRVIRLLRTSLHLLTGHSIWGAFRAALKAPKWYGSCDWEETLLQVLGVLQAPICVYAERL